MQRDLLKTKLLLTVSFEIKYLFGTAIRREQKLICMYKNMIEEFTISAWINNYS